MAAGKIFLEGNDIAFLDAPAFAGEIARFRLLLAALRAAGETRLAAAPDFTEDLVARRLSAAQARHLSEQGEIEIEDCYGGAPYALSRQLIEDGRNNLVLPDKIALSCPVILLQGQADPDVPWSTALRLAQQLQSPDVRVVLLKSAGHRLSEPSALRLMLSSLQDLITLSAEDHSDGAR